MAEFPPNLDDGELWLPSDIFRNDVSIENHLSSHFAAFSLLQNHPPKHPFNNSQKLKPAGFWGLDGGAGAEFDTRVYGYGIGSSLNRVDPVYEFRIQSPETSQVRMHVNAYQVDNNRGLRGRQQDPIQNRVYGQFKPSGYGFCGGCGGSVKESGGTGVFHPRIVNPTAEVKRKLGGKHEQRNSMRKVGVKKQEECYYHLPPEMGLPKDWTY
ncbi:embryo sac development arrest 12 [Euphorbia peplus]|nr:embryo sac development arrest 12 [Euphorbia peplus]